MTTSEEVIALAKEAGMHHDSAGFVTKYNLSSVEYETLERFANLVAAKGREKVAHWMMQRALATGHGDTIEDMLTELEWQIREKEREECAKVCETHAPKGLQHGLSYAAAIRARKP